MSLPDGYDLITGLFKREWSGDDTDYFGYGFDDRLIYLVVKNPDFVVNYVGVPEFFLLRERVPDPPD